MAVKVGEIFEFLNEIAPFSSSLSFDNTGLLVGSFQNEVEVVLVALDLNSDVLNEAKELGAGLIITHHPIIFHPVKRILKTDFLYSVVESKISVISAHTNLDIASEGVGFCLATALSLKNIEVLEGSDGCGRVGSLGSSCSCEQFLENVSKKLNAVLKAVVVDVPIRKVAVVPGSGGFALNAAINARVDALVVGECRHSDFVEAFNEGFCLVAAGHFETENLVCSFLKQKLSQRFAGVKFVVSSRPNSSRCFFGDLKWL